MISSRHCGVADFDADMHLQKPDLAVTLSMGERPVDDRQRPGRIDLLKILREPGYEIGSGVTIGIPGQSMESPADDILLFQTLHLDMIGLYQ